jgi:hypothetical protein
VVVVSIALVEKVKVTALFLLISSRGPGRCFMLLFSKSKKFNSIECLSRKL